MYLTVCLNPTLQKTLRFSSLVSDAVNRTRIHRLDASGKGINVTRVLQQLGKKAVHLTQLGGVMRPLFLSRCKQDSLTVEWVESAHSQESALSQESADPIRFCYTLINDADSSVTELVEESRAVAAGTEERLLERFDSLVAANDFLIISGTKAAGFSDDVIPSMVKKAKERGLKIILDIKGTDLIESLRYEPAIIKPNLQEFASTYNIALVDNEDAIKGQVRQAALELCEKYHCRIILTRGARPIWACEAGHFFEVDFEPVKWGTEVQGTLVPLNTTGSGDAFTAGLAAAIDDGADFTAAIAEGSRCGALNAQCFKPGVIKEKN